VEMANRTKPKFMNLVKSIVKEVGEEWIQ
jgi:hypothetical protein